MQKRSLSRGVCKLKDAQLRNMDVFSQFFFNLISSILYINVSFDAWSAISIIIIFYVIHCFENYLDRKYKL